MLILLILITSPKSSLIKASFFLFFTFKVGRVIGCKLFIPFKGFKDEIESVLLIKLFTLFNEFALKLSLLILFA